MTSCTHFLSRFRFDLEFLTSVDDVHPKAKTTELIAKETEERVARYPGF
jgi:hypothetical protein